MVFGLRPLGRLWLLVRALVELARTATITIEFQERRPIVTHDGERIEPTLDYTLEDQGVEDLVKRVPIPKLPFLIQLARDRQVSAAAGISPATLEPVKRKPSKSSKTSKKPAKPKTVSLAIAAEELNLGKRRIQQLAKEGLPRVRRGAYNLVDCFRWYIRFLQRKIIQRAIGTDGDATSSAARNTLLYVESELKQIQLTKLREQFISRDRVDKDMKAIVREIRRAFGALSPKIASAVLAETDLSVSQVKIDRELKCALEALSNFDPDDEIVKTS